MNDDLNLESISFPFDKYLTVLGLLKSHYGIEHGMEIYELLKRTAEETADSIDNKTKPAILFNDDGGEFVGVET
jgi:hypothetical protein